MSCRVKQRSLDFLREKKAIGDKRVITDLDTFRELNQVLTNLAYTKYGVGNNKDLLFTETTRNIKLPAGNTQFILRADTNDQLFNTLQQAINDFEEFNIDGRDLSDLVSNSIQEEAFTSTMRTVVEDEADLLTDVSTLEKKLGNVIDKINQSLKQTIKGLEIQGEREIDEEKKANIALQVKSLRDIQTNVLEFQATNQILALETFAEVAISNLQYIERSLNRVDLSDKDYVTNAVKTYKIITSAYSILPEVRKVMSAARQDISQTIATEEDLQRISAKVSTADSDYNAVSDKLYDMLKGAMKFYLNDIKYFPEIEKKHYNRLAKEHKQSKIPLSKEAWIKKTMEGRDKDLIENDLQNSISDLIENPSWDIYAADVQFSSSINVSDRLIQIMNQILLEIDSRRNNARIEKDKQFKKLFEKLVDNKGTSDIKKLYENILDFDSNGKAYIKGEYQAKFYSDIHLKMFELKREYKDKIDKVRQEMLNYPINSDEFNKRKEIITNLVNESKSIQKQIQTENFNENADGSLSIKDKWKNDLSKLNDTEKEVLDFFINLTEDIRKATYPTNPENNIKYSFGAKFFELPKITKKDSERLWTGDGIGIVTDKIRDIKNVRPDDIGYRTEHTDLTGRKINSLKLWYRDPTNTFKNSDQSLDLMTIMRMDYINAITYQIRGESEQELNFLLDIAKNKSYYQKGGTLKLRNNWNKKYRTVEGVDSQVYKMMSNMLESRFYDTMNKNNIKIAGADLNKVFSFVNNASAFLTLSLNIASGTANVINANAQLFLESFLKGHFITAKGIKKANEIYSINMLENMKDIQRPINRSFVNQVNEYFNIRGLFNLSNANFLKNDLLKAGMTAQSLQVLQESGEHYIQSITSMSILDGIKVMNENGEFINKKGEIVNEKKAASILDMMEVDKVTGVVSINDKVSYTTHSRLTKWNEGGKEKVDMLIRKKLYDIVGNYTETDQPEIMRAWYGKLLMLYRKFFVPMGQARLRGIETAFKQKSKLTPDERRFSYALQEFEEGTYTSFIRYVLTSIQEKKFYLTSKERIWDSLSDYEKHNIKRAVTEAIVTNIMLPILAQLMASLGDGDDDGFVYFTAYQLRRLDTELSQYWNVGETFKMMRSPIPSARLLETSISLFLDTMQPWKWDDEYEGGFNKGKNKMFTRFKKQIPVVKEFQRTYADLFEFQNSSWGTGL